MGRIAKQVSEHTTRYYWYPGDKKEWTRAGIALGVGAGVFALVWLVAGSTLPALVTGASATAALAGINFGRRDARALAGFPDLGEKAARRAAVAHTGRAAWRALVEGVGGASAALLIVNLPAHGFLANWMLPLVPAMIGALAHQFGMLYERVARSSQPASTLHRTPRAAPLSAGPS